MITEQFQIALLKGEAKTVFEGKNCFVPWDRITVEEKEVVFWQGDLPVQRYETFYRAHGETLTIMSLDGRFPLSLSGT